MLNPKVVVDVKPAIVQVMKYLEFVIMWRCIQEARFLRPHNRWNEEIAMLPNGFLAFLGWFVLHVMPLILAQKCETDFGQKGTCESGVCFTMFYHQVVVGSLWSWCLCGIPDGCGDTQQTTANSIYRDLSLDVFTA